MGRYSDALRQQVDAYGESEWMGNLGGVDVHLKSLPLTNADIMNVNRKHKGWINDPTPEAMIDCLILKARSFDDGQKAFDMADKPMLMRMTTEDIGEIFQALLGSAFEDTHEASEERVKK